MTGRYTALVAYHQAYLAPGGTSPVLDAQQPPTLAQVIAHGTGLILNTGISMGPVALTITATPVPPGEQPDWEERQDLALHVTEDLYLSAPTIDNPGIPGAVYTPTTPGGHTVTVLARGRASHWDATLEPGNDPTEEYLIAITILPSGH